MASGMNTQGLETTLDGKTYPETVGWIQKWWSQKWPDSQVQGQTELDFLIWESKEAESLLDIDRMVQIIVCPNQVTLVFEEPSRKLVKECLMKLREFRAAGMRI